VAQGTEGGLEFFPEIGSGRRLGVGHPVRDQEGRLRGLFPDEGNRRPFPDEELLPPSLGPRYGLRWRRTDVHIAGIRSRYWHRIQSWNRVGRSQNRIRRLYNETMGDVKRKARKKRKRSLPAPEKVPAPRNRVYLICIHPWWFVSSHYAHARKEGEEPLAQRALAR